MREDFIMTEKDKPEHPVKPEHPDKPWKPEHPVHPEHPVKPEHPEKPVSPTQPPVPPAIPPSLPTGVSGRREAKANQREKDEIMREVKETLEEFGSEGNIPIHHEYWWKLNHYRSLGVFAFIVLSAVSLIAGNAHFVGVPQLSAVESSLLASGKVAGLGNIPQIHVEVSGDASCVNRGNKNPSAENKDSFSAGGDFPVQNGKALFLIEVEATFQPDCSPPMRVVWSNVRITVTAEDGTFLQFP
jgi:hypothetical protein